MIPSGAGRRPPDGAHRQPSTRGPHGPCGVRVRDSDRAPRRIRRHRSPSGRGRLNCREAHGRAHRSMGAVEGTDHRIAGQPGRVLLVRSPRRRAAAGDGHRPRRDMRAPIMRNLDTVDVSDHPRARWCSSKPSVLPCRRGNRVRANGRKDPPVVGVAPMARSSPRVTIAEHTRRIRPEPSMQDVVGRVSRTVPFAGFPELCPSAAICTAGLRAERSLARKLELRELRASPDCSSSCRDEAGESSARIADGRPPEGEDSRCAAGAAAAGRRRAEVDRSGSTPHTGRQEGLIDRRQGSRSAID